MRARDLGLACGSLPPGTRNSIADVAGVGVGHTTLNEGDIHTGVTAIVPHPGDPFRDKLPAAAVVLNGFGKSIGLMQLNELGTLETPILLSNTFAVGNCANALIRRAIATNPEIGRRSGTVNPVVLECNDGYLNNLQAMAVTEVHACTAIEAVQADFARGNVGAGTGMSCFGLKGGIGSASRRVRLDDTDRYLGVLVLANFGNAGELVLPTREVIPAVAARTPETGSCVVVIGTDIPLEHRQLRRVAARAGVGLAWCGSFWGTASGDIALAFTTANKVPHQPDTHLLSQGVMAEQGIDLLFRAVAEATEEAVFDALAAADTLEGRDGHRRISLREILRR